MLKPSDNPPILPEGVHAPSELPGPWWVAHTKARHEKAFARDMENAHAGYFLPLIQRTMVSGGRKRKVMHPLFPSYVFFTGDDDTRYQAMTTNRLCTVIPAEDQARLVRELDQLNLALRGEADLDPYPGLATGRAARVKAGPFRGIEGAIVHWQGQARLLLQVSMLGQGATIEIEPDLLEAVEQTPTSSAGGLAKAPSQG